MRAAVSPIEGAEVDVVERHIVMAQRPSRLLGLRVEGVPVSHMESGAADVERRTELALRREGAAAYPSRRLQDGAPDAFMLKDLRGSQACRTDL